MTFRYISEAGMGLTQSQKDLLSAIEQAPCKLDEFSSVSTLRKARGYKVVVSDRESFRDTINKEIEVYKEYNEELIKKFYAHKKLTEQESGLFEYHVPIKDRIEDIRNRVYPNLNTPYLLLGLYRNYDYSYNSPVIYLFKENIDDYAKANKVNAEYVFGFVYVHEAMHAYYDSKNNKGFLPVTELEEAFAECGMIEFLKQTSSLLPKQLNKVAIDSVQNEQSSGPYEYGFGLALADLSSSRGQTLQFMSRYREFSNWLNCFCVIWHYQETVSSLKRKYSPNDPEYDKKAKECYAIVEKILSMNYPPAKVNLTDTTGLTGIEDKMREAGVTPKTGANKSKGISSSSKSTSKLYTFFPQELVYLIASPSLNDLVYAIFKSEEGQPRLQEMINHYGIKTKLEGDTAPGVWLDETLVFPDGSVRNLQGGWFLDPIKPGHTNVLRLLRPYLEFTILKVENDYVLYGPYQLRSLYEQIERDLRLMPRKLDLTTSAKYNLVDLNGTLHEKLSMTGLVREGIKSFVAMNPALTAAQIQAEFPATLGPRNQDVILPVASIPSNRDTRYDRQIIHASDVDFRVNNQWIITYIRPIIKKFESLGMKVDW